MIEMSKSQVIKTAQEAAGAPITDTGSPEVQVSLLSWQISQLQVHLKQFPKDKTAHRRLLHNVDARRSMLRYLDRLSNARYDNLIKRLELRSQRRSS